MPRIKELDGSDPNRIPFDSPELVAGFAPLAAANALRIGCRRSVQVTGLLRRGSRIGTRPSVTTPSARTDPVLFSGMLSAMFARKFSGVLTSRSRIFCCVA